MVASILLMQRKGIGEDELISRVEWLRDLVKSLGYNIGGVNGGSA